LIVGRAIQGAGAAGLAPGSLSLLASAFTDPRERIQAVGIWSGISGIALAAGSVIGGGLIQVAGWPAIFLVNIPIAVLGLAVGVGTLAESRNPTARRADIPGQVLVIAGLLALTYALIQGNALGWASPVVVGLLASAVLLVAAFVVVEARSTEPMLPLSLFASARVTAAVASSLIVGFSLLGIAFFAAQYFQAIQGFDALQAGLRALPLTMGMFVAAPFAGRIAARYGFRPPILAGALSAAAGAVLMANITPTTSYGDLWWKLTLAGLGFGLMLSPLTSAVMTSTPPALAGLASSLVNASRQVGALLGVALLGSVLQHVFASNLVVRLTGLGVPAGQSAEFAVRLAQAGSQAAQVQTSGLPLDASALQTLTAGAFTDALQVAYVIAGIAVLLVAIMALTMFRAAPAHSQQAQQVTRAVETPSAAVI
jgi:DHA2 family methylenomycin A resistance protein-like MFS transporter